MVKQKSLKKTYRKGRWDTVRKSILPSLGVALFTSPLFTHGLSPKSAALSSERESNPGEGARSPEKTLTEADLTVYVDYPNGDDASDFTATAVDSATGTQYPMDVVGNKATAEGLRTPVEENNQSYPAAFELSPPYPNPTVSNFNIKVGLAEHSNVTVGVYDILGREVDTRSYGTRSPGYHEVFCQGLDLPSGVYILRAMVNGRAMTEKALVLKGNGNNGTRADYNALGKVLGGISFVSCDVPEIAEPNPDNYRLEKANQNGVTYFVQLRSNKNPVEFENKDMKVHLVNDTTIYATANEPIEFGDTVSAKEDSGLVVSIDSLVQGNYGLQTVDIASGSSVMYTDRQGNNLVISTDNNVNSTDYGLLPLNISAVAPHGTEAEGTVYVDVKEMTDFLAHVVDNQSLEILQHGRVMINGREYSTDNGLIELQVDPADSIAVSAWGVSPDTVNTFKATYQKTPMSEDWGLPAGLMVTTYDNLTNVEPDKAVSPGLFRVWAQECNMYDKEAPAHGLRSIDWQNAQNPVPNPEGENGVIYWIDRDRYNTINSDTYGTLSEQEQLNIKDIIKNEILANIRDPAHKPQIYVAQPGEKPPLETDPVTQQQRLASGTIIVTHRNGGQGYNFSWQDYDNDGIVDAAIATVGDPTNLNAKILSETASIIVPTGSHNTEMNDKTINHQIDPASSLTPADLKMLSLQENVNKDTDWAQYQLPNGTQVMRGYYKPLSHIDDILKVE